MDEEFRSQLERDAERHALYNALKHDGPAAVEAVIGPLMGEHAEYRPHGDAVASIVAGVVETVNELDPDDRRRRLESIDPDLAASLGPDENDADPEATLPPLPNVDEWDAVRMRCAPNPNGPWHLGHARMPAVIGTYKARYDGWMLCRFDDTDPETKRPDLDAYDAILEAITYLGFEADAVITASDRLELYYRHARRLIEVDGAYICTCSAERFSELKAAGTPCPHRGRPAPDSLAAFEGMVDGEYRSGEIVLRVATDMDHKNPAIRDWVGFRQVDTPHPRPEAREYRCWPTLDFQSAIDDHLTEISHIIRGIDLQDSARRQRYIYDRFGWRYPEVIHWGHVRIDEYDVDTSTSTIRRLIQAGELEGWDDPRAPTIASVRRRGIQGPALTEAMIDLGTSTSDVELSMSAVYARNRERIDARADRYFLVRNGVELPILDGGEAVATPARHPDYPDRGVRRIPVGSAVLVESGDVPANGARVWLKGLGPVRHVRDALEPIDADIDVVREEGVPVVHWVPAETAHPVCLRTVDGDVDGRAEPGFPAAEVGAVVQFERVGFARVDAHDEDGSVAYFAHP